MDDASKAHQDKKATVLVIENGDKQVPAYIAAVINPTKDYTATTKLSDLQGEQLAYASSDYTQKGTFVMTNAVYKGEQNLPVIATPITIDWNWSMNREVTEAAISIEPAIEGSFSWENYGTRLVFTPTHPFKGNTLYTVRIATTASHPDTVYANTLQEEYVSQFLTESYDKLNLLTVSPNTQQTPLRPTFFLMFDSKLSSTECMDRIYVVDENDLERMFREVAEMAEVKKREEEELQRQQREEELRQIEIAEQKKKAELIRAEKAKELAKRQKKTQNKNFGVADDESTLDFVLNFSDTDEVRRAFIASEIFNKKY